MTSSRWGLSTIVLLAVVFACGGCGTPLLVQVETTIHADGSCNRTIWQPEKELLPAEARSPEWRAMWTRTEAVKVPPALRDVARQPDHAYFKAMGAFPSVEAIPPHYERSAPDLPGGPTSVLTRAYERRDFGFVAEHRWSETVTNIVNRDDFLKARDELLDLGLPMLTEAIDHIYGADLDVSRLRGYLRHDGRTLVEKAAMAYFEVSSRHLDEKQANAAYARSAREIGLDLFDGSGVVADSQETNARVQAYLRHRLALGIRHRDGSRLTATEIDGIIAPGPGSPYTARAEAYLKTHQDALKGLLRPLVRMTGLYQSIIPFAPSGASLVRFAFRVRLPGEIVETNGKADGPGWVSWRFSGDDLYPAGLTMIARSLEIDEAAQRAVLGRVAIKGRADAEALAAILNASEPLRALVVRVRETRNPRLLRDHSAGTAEERVQIAKVCHLLGITE